MSVAVAMLGVVETGVSTVDWSLSVHCGGKR